MGEKYTTDKAGNELYVKSTENKVIFIKINGDEIYAKTNLSEEYYPDTEQIAKNKLGKPIYAKMPNNSIIFKKNNEGDEIYLKDDEGNDHIENVYNIRYAKRKSNDEYYPLIKDEFGDFNETILQNSYAKDSNNKLFYPIDKIGHEVWHESNISTPDDYPITNDNYFLVPQKNSKPYFLNHLEPKLTDENIIGTISRVDGSISYATDMQCDNRKSRGAKTPYKINYIQKDDDGNVNKTSNTPNLNEDDDVESDFSENSESDDEPMVTDENDNNDNKKTTNTATTTTNNNNNNKTLPKPPIRGYNFDFYFIIISIITIVLGLLAWYVKKRLLF